MILSTTGIETDRFNRIIINQVEQKKNVKLELQTIDFKLDIKKFSLFLDTNQPNIVYKDILVPSDNIKVYIDFLSLFKNKINIKKINITLSKLNIDQARSLSKLIKPSNFKNFLNNKIKKADVISEIEIFFNEDGVIDNFLINGNVKNLEVNILDYFNLSKTNFSFIADKEDILIKKIFGNLDTIKILNGDIKFDLRNGLKLKSNFDTNINIDQKKINIYKKIFNNQNLINNIELFSGDFNNNVSIDLDETYKVKNFNYDFSGKLKKVK